MSLRPFRKIIQPKPTIEVPESWNPHQTLSKPCCNADVSQKSTDTPPAEEFLHSVGKDDRSGHDPQARNERNSYRALRQATIPVFFIQLLTFYYDSVLRR
jgi:hypothetical protein